MTLDALTEALRRVLGKSLAERTTGTWSGYQAPLGGAQTLAPNEPGWQPFPFRTESAEVLWRHIIKILPMYPELQDGPLIQKAIGETGIRPLDLSPEDWRLLEMAVEWRRNGLTGMRQPITAPADPKEYGHHLAKRGAP